MNRSKLGKRSKDKGKGYELEVLHWLEEIGFDKLFTSRRASKATDDAKVDLYQDPEADSKLPINVQCKYTQNTPNFWEIYKDYMSIDAPTVDKERAFVIFWKKSMKDRKHSPGSLVMAPVSHYLELLEFYIKNRK